MKATFDELSNLIGNIYEAAHRQMEWTDVIRDLRGLFDGSRACLALYSDDPSKSHVLSTDLDEGMTARFFDFGPSNEWMDGFNAAPLGRVYSDHAIVGHERLRKSAIWNEWLRPQDMYGSLSCKLSRSDNSVWFLDIQRGRRQPSFDDRDGDQLRLLVPHITRAVQISERLAVKDALSTAAHAFPFGCIIADRHARVVKMNAVAGAILEESSDLIAINGGHLAASAKNNARLQRLVQSACGGLDGFPAAGGELTIRSSDGLLEKPRLILSTTPLAGGRVLDTLERRYAAIYIQQISLSLPAGFSTRVQNAFDLAPAEARLAAHLAGGSSVREAALELGVSFGTARRYLERIFQKTDTHQQSQLVALLKTAVPFSQESTIATSTIAASVEQPGGRQGTISRSITDDDDPSAPVGYKLLS